MRQYSNTLLFVLTIVFTGFAFSHGSTHFPQISIKVNDIPLQVDLAQTPDARAHGLQHKKFMCDDCGMLFEFEFSRVVSFWMKNTLIPLDIAYIKKDGTIVDIKPMEPFNEEGVLSSEAVIYALEMNQGWFASHKVKVGDTVLIGHN